MTWLKHILFSRRLSKDLSDEIQQHLEEKVDELVATGLRREEAVQVARRTFGDVNRIEEQEWEVWSSPWIDNRVADLTFAFRQLRRNPSFALVVCLSLALGIGATTVIFSVVYGVLIDPYPYRDSGRIMHVHVTDKGAFASDLPLSSSQFQRIQSDPALDGAIAMDEETMAATGEDLPESVQAGFLSLNASEYFGVLPLFGRWFSAVDAKDPSHPENVVLLGYRYWRAHYAAQRDVLGKRLQLDHQDYTIIGVLPKRFGWWSRDVYLPLKYSSDPDRTSSVFVRLKTRISVTAARAELQNLVQQFQRETPGHFPREFRIELVRLNDILIGSFSGTIIVIFAAVFLLLLVGCTNVSILMLARGFSRERELAIRTAIGASRNRLAGQLLTESMVLSLAGAFVGVLLAYFGVKFLPQYLPPGTFPEEASFRLSLPVLIFTTSVAMLTGGIFGLWPAWRLSRPSLNELIQSGSHKIVSDRDTRQKQRMLIAGQVALSIILVSLAVATMRSLDRLSHVALGYDPVHVASVTLQLGDNTYTEWGKRVNYFAEIRNKVAGTPELTSAAIAYTWLPPISLYRSRAEIPSVIDANPLVTMQQVSAEYFSTLRIPMVQGRSWTNPEVMRAAHVAIINTAMASHYWPNQDPIGRMIHLDELRARSVWTLSAPGNNGWVQVVGVVANTPNNGLREPVLPTVYVPYTLVAGDTFDLVVRTTANPLSVIRSIRERIHEVNQDQTVEQVTTAEQRLELEGFARERFIMLLFSCFAMLGLCLAGVGIYSVASYAVSQRTREFAVRLAFGARRSDVLQSALKTTAVTILAGVAVGSVASLAIGRLVGHWIEGKVHDPIVLVTSILVLLVITGIASAAPAIRAICITPMAVLRQE